MSNYASEYAINSNGVYSEIKYIDTAKVGKNIIILRS